MQRQLILLRHAKAATLPDGNDFDRPLTPRGTDDVSVLAQWLAQQPFALSAAYVSSAARTQQTWQQLQLGWQPKAPVAEHTLDGLYLASAGDFLDTLQRLPDAQQSVMVIGHNPGLHVLALLLCAPQQSDAYERLELGFATCSCACLSFELAHWRDVAPHSAQLEHLWQPSHKQD